ncbi:MAG: hypothetical protein ACFE9I_10235 [Candidatus Hermodarchaeota archaeon]
MVLIMITSWIPFGKEKEAGQKYIEVTKKYPMDRTLEKNLVPLGVRATKKGIKVFTVTEVKKGKYEEMIKRISEMQLAYSEIPGFKYTIETFLSGIDAMPMVGLMMPEL